jgi:hypothetical protein
MRRRRFIAGLGAAAASPLAARAQQLGGVRRVGLLMNGVATDSEFQSYVAVFIQGLRQLGWVEGQNLHVDVRRNAGNAGLAQTYAAQLIGLLAGRDPGRVHDQPDCDPASHQHRAGRVRRQRPTALARKTTRKFRCPANALNSMTRLGTRSIFWREIACRIFRSSPMRRSGTCWKSMAGQLT